MPEDKQAGTPGTTVGIYIEVRVNVELIPEHYFTEPGFGRDPDILIQHVHGHIDADGHMQLEGRGKQIKADGAPGSANRTVHPVRALPDSLAAKIRESAKAAVAEEAAKFAASP